MELTRVLLKDVVPDENNPRQEFSGIDELAESFKLNAERPGEPFVPPIVVRDGGIYRIVDGERRYRAMKSLGVLEFAANVCDDFGEADAMVAMLATDDKAQLTDLEKSRGVQRMLLLGVDPEKVERAARVESGGAARVKRAMGRAEGAAEEMTIERLFAIDEFADDDAAVEAIMGASERDWRYVAMRCRDKREAARRVDEMRERVRELADAGEIAYYTDRGCAEEDGFSYRRYARSAAAVDDFLREYGGAELACTFHENGYNLYVKTEGEDEPDPEAEERERLRDELKELHDAYLESARSWFASALMAGGIGQAGDLEARCREGFDGADYVDVEGTYAKYPELVGGLSRIDYAIGFEGLAPMLYSYEIGSVAAGTDGAGSAVVEFLDFMDLMADAGMPGPEGGARLRSLLEAYRDREADDGGEAA